ncbi:ATP-binding protein [Halobium palmae]|uniref:ATP-binding protein n=1 Tax=Halobium palmae TaxID=1776492 RepID=A0ABD5RWB2_9EURY
MTGDCDADGGADGVSKKEQKQLEGKFDTEEPYEYKIVPGYDFLAPIDVGTRRFWRDNKGETTVSFDDLTEYDDELVRDIRKRPLCGMWALTKNVREVNQDNSLHARIGDLEESDRSIESLRADDLYSFVNLDVTVKSRSGSYPIRAVWMGKCSICGDRYGQYQPRHGPENTLENCTKESCDGYIEVNDKEHKRITTQEVVFQDLHRNSDSSNPSDMPGYVNEDLIGQFDAGEEVRICAIVLPRERDGTAEELYLHIVGIETANEDYDVYDISDEEMEQIEALSNKEHIHHKIAESIAPGLATTESVELGRMAIAHLLAGGDKLELNGGTHRGQIHGALIGDPGTAKSSLLEYASMIAPKSVEANADNMSAAGLTAAAIKEEAFNRSEWTLHGGAVVRAHEGVCTIDELDKFDFNEQDKLHTPMESGVVNVAKANINATLKAESSILVAANPTDQRFSPFDEISEQIDIAPALWSRFEFIIPFKDEVDEEIDRKIFEKYKKATSDEDSDAISPELMKKYLVVARENKPELTEEAIDYCADVFEEARSQSDVNRVSISMRKAEGLIRLAQASANLRLGDEVTIEDAERAEDIIMSALKMVSTDQYGNLDADVLSEGPSAQKRNTMLCLLDIIDDLSEACTSGKPKAEKQDVLELAQEEDIKQHRAEAALKRLQNDGQIWYNGTHYGIRD